MNRAAKSLLENHFDRVWVEGELSNFARPSSGHWYFTLKDDRAQVRCALFRQHNARLRFKAGILQGFCGLIKAARLLPAG